MLVVLLFCLVGGSRLLAQNSSAQQEKPIDSWYHLTAPEAAAGKPIELEGTVLCYDAGWGQLYLHQGASVLYLNPGWFTNQFEVGELVRVNARSGWDGTATILTNGTATVLGRRPLPQAASLKIRDMGQLHGQWIETRGQVRIVETSRERVALQLRDGEGQHCLVYIMRTSTTNDCKHLADTWVTVRGINSSRLESGRLHSAILTAPALDQVIVTRDRSFNRWELEATPISSLLARPPGRWTNDPVRVNGIVTTCQPGSRLAVRDPTGILDAEIMQINPAAPGKRVDVWGFLTLRSNRTFLADAYFELTSPLAASARPTTKPKHQSADLPALTEVRQIRTLSKEAANENLHAEIRGVVTYADPEWRVVFFQDQHDAIFLDIGQADLRPGQWVEVTGQTDCSGYAPQLINCSATILGTTNWPRPIKADLHDAAGGQLDCLWVEMEGIVRRVGREFGRTSLTLSSSKGMFAAVVLDPGEGPPPLEWVDSLVTVRGACGSKLNTRGQLSGITLHVPGRDQITILQPGPANPFEAPSTPIDKIGTFNLDLRTGRRLKVTGIATLVAPGGVLYVQDEAGGIRIQCAELDHVELGQRVEVVGFPLLRGFSPSIEEATLRVMGNGALPPPVRTTADQILATGKHDGAVVELQAEVIQSHSDSAQPKLTLRDGSVMFTAQLAWPGPNRTLPRLTPGSIVRVRGVCAIQATEANEPAGFQVLLPESRSVTLRKAAPWWTPRHTVLLLSGTAIVALSAGLWILMLRRQVRAQTEIIRRNQQELLETSRRAGMAEVATNVLHNVGNILNSVNVSAQLASETIQASSSPLLGRTVDLMEQHQEDLAGFITQHPRGRKLPQFLRTLAGRLAEENTTLARELGSLRKNIEHIKGIVATQQSFARTGGPVEALAPADLLEEALHINSSNLARSDVRVKREYDSQVGEVTVDKHKILQILVNLIRNASQACADSSQPNKEITLSVVRNNGCVRLAVHDNGVGIAPENLTRIFHHGFTTRKDGHGFGLHSGALAAKQMGGHLAAESPGPGCGARFTLELPVTPST